MTIRIFLFLIFVAHAVCRAQGMFPHPNAHAHNDYEHALPLKEAIKNGFISVEADVHLQNGKLLVSHNRPKANAATLEILYLAPLDSILKANGGQIYAGYSGIFFLMIDCKTEAITTYEAIKKAIEKYPALQCSNNCPVRIFLSGNRSVSLVINGGSTLALDGRPDDLGKGYSKELMPVISDNFKNWSDWHGKSMPSGEDLRRVKQLASQVHAEGKKLRLWAIPDNEVVWAALLTAGVDLINSDRLMELNSFLSSKGL